MNKDVERHFSLTGDLMTMRSKNVIKTKFHSGFYFLTSSLSHIMICNI